MKKVFIFLVSISVIISSCVTNNASNANELSSSSLKNSSNVRNDSDTVPLSSDLGSNILIDQETAFKYISTYENQIRKPALRVGNDKMTKSVWFDIKSLNWLINYIKRNHSNSVDGVRFHFMAYDENDIVKGQYSKHQMSIVLVPTEPGVNNNGERIHKDNWNLLEFERQSLTNLYQSNKGANKVKGGLNHGQLCPQKCD
jgi:hypothetical protein